MSTGVFRRPPHQAWLRQALRRSAAALVVMSAVAVGGGPALVRSTPKGSASNASSVAASFSATPTVGNLIIVMVSGWREAASFGVTSVTDNQGNTYAHAGTVAGSSGLCRAEVWYAKAVTSSGTFTVTVNAGSGSYIEFVASEFSGMAASSQFDVGAQADATSGDAAVGPTATLAQASEVVIAVASISNDDTNITVDTPAGYTRIAVNQNANATIGFEASYKIVSATTAVSAAWSHDNTNQAGWSAKIATFKA